MVVLDGTLTSRKSFSTFVLTSIFLSNIFLETNECVAPVENNNRAGVPEMVNMPAVVSSLSTTSYCVIVKTRAGPIFYFPLFFSSGQLLSP